MEGAPHTIRFGAFTVDPADRRLLGPHGEIHLGGRAFDVLQALLAAEGRLVTKEQLFDSVWDGRAVSDGALTAVIRELRLALGESGRDGMIHVVYGRGYRLEAEVQHVDGVAPVAEAQPASGEAGEVPLLAVLPFANLSDTEEDAVFTFSMVEDLIDALSQGVNLRVLSHSAILGFLDGRVPNPADVARDLGVRYVLEGNMRRSGAGLRVTAQLTDAATGTVLWTRKFERPLADLAALQEEMVLEIAHHLNAQVYGQEIARVLRKTGGLTALDAVMRSRAALVQLFDSNVSQMIEEAKRAVAIAPEDGLAVAMLANAESVAYLLFTPDDPLLFGRIVELARQAVERDPNNAHTLATVAIALANIGELSESLSWAERAVAISPDAEMGHFALGIICVKLHRLDEAIAHFDKHLQVAPGSIFTPYAYGWQACAHVRAGRWLEARAAYDCGLALNPRFTEAIAGRAVLCWHLGEIEEAKALMRRCRELEPRVTLELWEGRWRNWNVNDPKLPEWLKAIRALWMATEPDGRER